MHHITWALLIVLGEIVILCATALALHERVHGWLARSRAGIRHETFNAADTTTDLKILAEGLVQARETLRNRHDCPGVNVASSNESPSGILPSPELELIAHFSQQVTAGDLLDPVACRLALRALEQGILRAQAVSPKPQQFAPIVSDEEIAEMAVGMLPAEPKHAESAAS